MNNLQGATMKKAFHCEAFLGLQQVLHIALAVGNHLLFVLFRQSLENIMLRIEFGTWMLFPDFSVASPKFIFRLTEA